MLSEPQWASFEQDGFLPLGQVAPDALLVRMQSRINEIMLGEVQHEGIYFQLDSETGRYEDVPFGDGAYAGPTVNYRKIERLERDPIFLSYMQLPLFREITQRVYGDSVSIYRAMFMNKPAGRGTVLPYHQDGGAQWGLNSHPLITVWTALDDSTRANGCVQVVPGTHKLGLLSERGHTITSEQEARYCQEDESVYLEARAGQAILLHNWLLHRSGVNTIDQPRRAFSVCYMRGSTGLARDPSVRFPLVFGPGAIQPVS